MKKSTPVERKMPRPWFTAFPSARSMSMLKADSLIRIAPLTEGERVLGVFVLPPFQRPPVWSQEQQIKLIESCWGGLPIGSIVYNWPSQGESPYDMWLLDGQQRVTAIYAYMNDEFPVLGYRFSELTVVDRRMWDNSVSLPTLICQSNNPDELRNIYDRLAYGGTAHEVIGNLSNANQA